MSGMILQFAFDYTDENREKMKGYNTMQSLLSHLKKQNLLEKFAAYGDKNGLQRRNLMLQKSQSLFERYIYSRIIYNMLDEEAWNEYLNSDDPTIDEALKIIRSDSAFPKGKNE